MSENERLIGLAPDPQDFEQESEYHFAMGEHAERQRLMHRWKEHAINHIMAYHKRWEMLATDYMAELVELEKAESPDRNQIRLLTEIIQTYNDKRFAAEQILKGLGHDVGW